MGDYTNSSLKFFDLWHEIGVKNGFFDLYHLSLPSTLPKHENYNLPLPPWQTQPIQPMYSIYYCNSYYWYFVHVNLFNVSLFILKTNAELS